LMLMRKHLTGARILDISQWQGDRVVLITLEGRDKLGDLTNKEIYLELMGRHSNLTLVENGKIIDAIRHITYDMSRVRQALPGLAFAPPPVQEKLNLQEAAETDVLNALRQYPGRVDRAIGRAIRGIGPETARELALRATSLENAEWDETTLPGIAARLYHFLEQLPQHFQPTLVMNENGAACGVLPFAFLSVDPALQRPCADSGSAMDAYFSGRDLRLRMEQRSASLRHQVRQALERSWKKQALQEEEIANGRRMEEWRVIGELLTAQGYLIPKGAKQAQLTNYYDENAAVITVELDPALTAAQNAQRYFKKYRKAHAALRLAGEQKEKTAREIEILENALDDLDKCETEDEMREVRAYLEKNGILKAAPQRKGAKRAPVSRPHHYLSRDGLHIYVGKNSAQNERLTHDAQGNDLWLHAKDMPGSHVILKKGDGQPPKSSLEDALRLAAYYSSAKGLRVPVDMTERRYVKKPGGTPDGFVTYTHQQTVLVTAEEKDLRALEKMDK
ncbi:MAG: NFACT family protein, partial [Clostridia bacterium]|nr:NFACT family protein [Clostridia bacterium]